MKALFTSKNLIGDGLYIGPALRQWHAEHPEYDIDLFTLNDHVTCIYSRMDVPLTVHTHPPQGLYDFEHVFDVSKCFALCDQRKFHIAEGYAALLGVRLLPQSWRFGHIKPIFIPSDEEIPDNLKGLVLVSMFSASCTSRDKNCPGLPPNKMLPWSKWGTTLRFLRSHFGDDKLRFLGAPDDRAPELEISEDEYLTGIPLNRLALIMRSSKCVITLDNGMSHLAASQEAKEIVLYPACLGLHYIVPLGNPNLAVLQMDPVQINAGSVVATVKMFVNQFGI